MKRILVSALIVLGLFLVKPGLCPASPAEVKEFINSVKNYWEASVRQDWAALYDFAQQDERTKMTREQYASAFPESSKNRYLSFRMGDVEISGGHGWAQINAVYKFAGFEWDKEKELKSWHAWQKVDNRWIPLPFDQLDVPSLPPGSRQLDDEVELRKRVDQFWKASENERTGEVWELCEPAFKEKMTVEVFRSKPSLRKYISHSLEWAQAANGSGRTRVRCEWKPADPSISKLNPEPLSFVQDWVKLNGLWYLQVQKTN